MFTLISTLIAFISLNYMSKADFVNTHPGEETRSFTPAIVLLILALLSAVPLGYLDGRYGIVNIGGAINFIGGALFYPVEIGYCRSLPASQAKCLKILAYFFSIAVLIGTALSSLL